MYTRKMHLETGEIKNIASTKHICWPSGEGVNRDEVDTRNILFRAWIDTPHRFSMAIAQHRSRSGKKKVSEYKYCNL